MDPGTADCNCCCGELLLGTWEELRCLLLVGVQWDRNPGVHHDVYYIYMYIYIYVYSFIHLYIHIYIVRYLY